MENVIVVGGSIAGSTAARTLRSLGYDAPITVIDPDLRSYARPSLSKAALRGEPVESSDNEDDGIQWRRGRSVVAHDVHGRSVQLDNGEHLTYDGLVIATGSRAIRLGGGDSGELVVRHLDDLERLRSSLGSGVRVVIIGGGLLGVELASGCRELGCQVTIITMDPLCERPLGGSVAAWLEERALGAGVEVVRTAVPVSRVDAVAGTVSIGETVVRGDVIVTAIGDMPAVEWTPLAVPRLGVPSDENGAVAPGIVVAGDAGFVRTPEGDRRDPHWYAAIEQGRIAAHTLLGVTPGKPAATRYIWTECFGHLVKLAGPAPQGPPTRVVESGPDGSGLFAWDVDDRVRSVIAIDWKIGVPRLRSMVGTDARPHTRPSAMETS